MRKEIFFDCICMCFRPLPGILFFNHSLRNSSQSLGSSFRPLPGILFFNIFWMKLKKILVFVSVPFRGFFFLILSPTPRHLCLSQTAFAWEIFFSPCSGPRTLQKTLPFRCLQGARENARLPGYPVTGLMS